MKRYVAAILFLLVLLHLSAVATAAAPQEVAFQIGGLMAPPLPPTPLPSGLMQFSLTVAGWVEPTISGTAGTPLMASSFRFDERGVVDPRAGRGTNHGIMTIETEGGELVIRFDGRITDVNLADFSGAVAGNWRILRGSGAFAGWHGQGTYTGNAGFVFEVDFEGHYHVAP